MAAQGEKRKKIPLWVVSSATEKVSGPYWFQSEAENAQGYAPGNAIVVPELTAARAFKKRPIK